MAIRKIVTIGDETLRKHCKPQEKFDKRLSTLLKAGWYPAPDCCS